MGRQLADIEERREAIRHIPWVSEITERPFEPCQGITLGNGNPRPCKSDGRWNFTTVDNKTRRFCFIHLVWRGLYSTGPEITRVNKFLKKKFPKYADGIIR